MRWLARRAWVIHIKIYKFCLCLIIDIEYVIKVFIAVSRKYYVFIGIIVCINC